MGRLPTLQELQNLRRTVKHLKLTFGPQHLATKNQGLNIQALIPRCQQLCELADTVIFKSTNGESVTLKQPTL